MSDLKMLELERFYVGSAMKKYAGGFFKAIGEAIAHAHLSNLRIIKETWNKEWNEYLEIGKKEYEKNGQF